MGNPYQFDQTVELYLHNGTYRAQLCARDLYFEMTEDSWGDADDCFTLQYFDEAGWEIVSFGNEGARKAAEAMLEIIREHGDPHQVWYEQFSQ